MKKVLLFGFILCVATGAFAFGGIGIGPWQRHKNQGVDAIGIHIDPNDKKADIDILDPCPDGLERNTDGSCTVCSNGNVYLSYMTKLDDPVGPCDTDTPMTGDCKSNADCESGQFCNLRNTDHNCEKPNAGTCTDIGEKNVDYVDEEITGLGKVRKSTADMAWWAAEQWCKAQGKNLVMIEDIGCYDYRNTDVLIAEGSQKWSYCCKKNAEDCNHYWYSYWDNKTLVNEEYVTVRYSPTIIALRQAFGAVFLWTISNYSSDNSCYVFGVELSSDYVGIFPRTNNFYALCK